MRRRSTSAASPFPTTEATAASRDVPPSLRPRRPGPVGRRTGRTRGVLDDERYDVPEAAGFDVALRGLSMVVDDDRLLELTGPLLDGLYEFRRRALMLGTEPA